MTRGAGVGGRLGGVFGWAGLTVLVGGGVLALEPLAGLSSNSVYVPELAWSVAAAVLIALLTVFALLLSAANPEARPEEGPERRQFLFRAFVATVGLFLVWAVFPTRHLDPEIGAASSGVSPEVVIELWAVVCLIALGLVLLLGASSALQTRRWLSALSGVGAGALAVVLAMTLAPAVTRLLMVEHTVAEAGREPAPVPEDVTQVGWTWQPEQPVVGMGRGPLGPIVRYADGFVALDGETGEELWSYRQPYAREVETGFFAGNRQRAYFLHQEGPESGVGTLVLLDTATGEVVRKAPVAAPDEDGLRGYLHLTPQARISYAEEDGQPLVVADTIDSDERLWEFSPDETPPGRRRVGGGAHGYGDRLVVTRVHLDGEHLPEGDSDEVNAVLRDMSVPDDAVRTLVVLDTATGEELWRHEDTPETVYGPQAAEIRTPRSVGGRPVAATHSGLFDLDTGEPVEALPEVPGDTDWARDELLAADTDGAVVLRRYRDSETSLLLRTGPGGDIVRSIEIDKPVGSEYLDPEFLESWKEDQAYALGGALLSTRSWSSSSVDEGERAVLTIPLSEGPEERTEADPATEEDLDWILFDGEQLTENAGYPGDSVRHRVLATPGAVVSYVVSPEGHEDPAPVHGLVP